MGLPGNGTGVVLVLSEARAQKYVLEILDGI